MRFQSWQQTTQHNAMDPTLETYKEKQILPAKKVRLGRALVSKRKVHLMISWRKGMNHEKRIRVVNMNRITI